MGVWPCCLPLRGCPATRASSAAGPAGEKSSQSVGVPCTPYTGPWGGWRAGKANPPAKVEKPVTVGEKATGWPLPPTTPATPATDPGGGNGPGAGAGSQHQDGGRKAGGGREKFLRPLLCPRLRISYWINSGHGRRMFASLVDPELHGTFRCLLELLEYLRFDASETSWCKLWCKPLRSRVPWNGRKRLTY